MKNEKYGNMRKEKVLEEEGYSDYTLSKSITSRLKINAASCSLTNSNSKENRISGNKAADNSL